MSYLTASWIGNVCDVLMVLIWAVYLQLFFRNMRRSSRPSMIIHHAQGNDPEALCLFVNMSKDPIHVQCVIAYIQTASGTLTRYVTDYRRLTEDDRSIRSSLREGPIQPGGYLELGSFEDILMGRQSDEGIHAQPGDLEGYEQLQLCVAVTHGPSEHHIGVRRTFAIEHNGAKVSIRAFSIYTEQLTTRKKRKIVREWVEERLNPQYEGDKQTEQTEQTSEKVDNGETENA